MSRIPKNLLQACILQKGFKVELYYYAGIGIELILDIHIPPSSAVVSRRMIPLLRPLFVVA
jgi:hypothetical protein